MKIIFTHNLVHFAYVIVIVLIKSQEYVCSKGKGDRKLLDSKLCDCKWLFSCFRLKEQVYKLQIST